MQVDRVGSAAELGRKQQDPSAQASPGDVGLGVGHLAHNGLALGANVEAACRRARCGPAFDPRIPDRCCLARDCCAGYDLDEIAAIDQ